MFRMLLLAPNAATDKVELSFTGLETDKGVIDVIDLTRSLNGWFVFWDHSAAAFINKELSLKPLSDEIRPRMKVRAFKHQSFDVQTEIVVPLALMAGYDIVKSLWKWATALIKKQIETKKSLITREAAIKALVQLANENGIITTTPLESIKFLDVIDESLSNLVEPINRSSKKIIIKSTLSKSTLQLGPADKAAMRSGYHFDPSGSAGVEKYSVKFIRINTQTGNSLITFDQPTGIYQIGHEYALIVDPAVRSPRNIYTRALYEGSSLEVWARKVLSQRTNKFIRWEISVVLIADDTPLFDATE
jgi:hypothetical protein